MESVNFSRLLILILLFSIFFVGSVSALAYDSSTVSHLPFNASTTADMRNVTWQNRGTPTIDTTLYKFGAGSLKLTGTNAVNTSGNPATIRMSGDFTVGAWINITSVSTGQCVWSIDDDKGGYVTTALAVSSATGGDLTAWVDTSVPGVYSISSAANTVTPNVWHYVAVTKKGQVVNIWYDGNFVKNGTSTSAYAPAKESYVGMRGYDPSPMYFTGGIDDFFIVNGYSMYSSNFTIPALEFGTSAGDTTPPNSITGLSNSSVNCSSIQWNWTIPSDTDYSHLYVLRNNAFLANYTNNTIGVLWTGLTASTMYNFSSKTVDLTGNMNATWVNGTATTTVCPTPTPTSAALPVFGDVYGFLSACNGITWILSIPSDSAYNGTMVYRNNTFLYNLTNASASEFWVGLSEGLDYTISTKAIYLNGSANNTWKNASSHTALCDCLLCGLVTTAPPSSGVPNLPAYRNEFWLKDAIMNNTWWILLLIVAILLLKRK